MAATNEVKKLTTENCSLEQLFASNTAKTLAKGLNLTPAQIAKANQAMLRIYTDTKLSGATQLSKLRYCYAVAQYNYKNEKAVVPVRYGTGVQAQLQYYAYIEDVLDTGLVEPNNLGYAKLYEGIDYKPYIDDKDNVILELPEKIVLQNMFDKKNVIGYYAYIKTKNGEIFTSLKSIEELKQHAARYSINHKAFLAKEIKTSFWSTNFESMAIKTVIKEVCNKFNKKYPTDRLQKALNIDQKVFFENRESYADNPENNEVIEPKKTTITNTIIDFSNEEKEAEETKANPVIDENTGEKK